MCSLLATECVLFFNFNCYFFAPLSFGLCASQSIILKLANLICNWIYSIAKCNIFFFTCTLFPFTLKTFPFFLSLQQNLMRNFLTDVFPRLARIPPEMLPLQRFFRRFDILCNELFLSALWFSIRSVTSYKWLVFVFGNSPCKRFTVVCFQHNIKIITDFKAQWNYNHKWRTRFRLAVRFAIHKSLSQSQSLTQSVSRSGSISSNSRYREQLDRRIVCCIYIAGQNERVRFVISAVCSPLMMMMEFITVQFLGDKNFEYTYPSS